MTQAPGGPSFDPGIIADAVARATDLQTAFDTLIGELTRALDTRACIFQRVERGWMQVAQARGGLRVSLSDLEVALDHVRPADRAVAVDMRATGEGTWTSLTPDDPEGPSVVILLAGDWTTLEALNPLTLLLSFALSAVREREAHRRTERLLVKGYGMARRLSRLGGLERVSQRIVEQVAQALHADRVAVALYRPEEDRLVIAATHGYSALVVQDVRIERGTWVIGHVYDSGRPVVVPDIRQIHGLSHGHPQYRTFSFAAVPMFAGAETLGVLSATDKRDGSPFDRLDAVALRNFSVTAALSIMATRSETEAHRLAYAATVDSLTGLFNRPYLDSRLHEEVERAKRNSSSLTVLVADIDDFKTVNDMRGHQAGDAVLQVVGGILRSSVRVFDICARYGGDEFVIVMPSSDSSSAAACAERIRQQVAGHYARPDDIPGLPRLTISIGVAVMNPGDKPADLIHRADTSLYQAKAEGKDRVRVSADAATLAPMPTPVSQMEGRGPVRQPFQQEGDPFTTTPFDAPPPRPRDVTRD